MKLTEEQIKKLTESWGDWEAVHANFDDLVLARLRELDPEFVEQIEKMTENAEFWYA